MLASGLSFGNMRAVGITLMIFTFVIARVAARDAKILQRHEVDPSIFLNMLG